MNLATRRNCNHSRRLARACQPRLAFSTTISINTKLNISNTLVMAWPCPRFVQAAQSGSWLAGQPGAVERASASHRRAIPQSGRISFLHSLNHVSFGPASPTRRRHYRSDRHLILKPSSQLNSRHGYGRCTKLHRATFGWRRCLLNLNLLLALGNSMLQAQAPARRASQFVVHILSFI